MTDKVKFRESPLFKETFAKHKSRVASKFVEFVKHKSNDPLAKFGSKDQHFTGGGALSKSGLVHAHLTHDISILYRRHSKDPTIIDLYAVATHDELGTGQPGNDKKQRQVSKQLASQEFS